MTHQTTVTFPKGGIDSLPAEQAPHFDPETWTLDLDAVDADFAELAELDKQLSAITRRIALLESEKAEYKEAIAKIEARLTGSASALGGQVNNGNYVIRYTPGRASTSWDAETLEKVLPDELKAVVMTYTPRADAPLLNQLERSGKLPPEALEAKKVKPAAPRYILERQ